MWYVYGDEERKLAINTDKIWHMCISKGKTLIFIDKDEITLPGEKHFDEIMKNSGKDIYRNFK
jgi:hypothetical protein